MVSIESLTGKLQGLVEGKGLETYPFLVRYCDINIMY